MAIPIRSQPNAVSRITDDIAARLSEIRAEERQLTTRLRALCHERARLTAMQMLAGIETED